MASIQSVLTGFKGRGRTGAVHPVDQVPPLGRLAVYGFQHVLAFYAGAVIVPLLLAAAIKLSNEQLIQLISADLFTCGIASIIQSVGFWKVGIRLPLIQGVTFTAVAPMIAIGNAAGGGAVGLREIYGAVIIGVTLVPVAIQDAGGGNPVAPNFASLTNLAFAAGTLLLILLIYRFFRGFLSTIAVLLGLVVGTSVAAAFGLVDFSGVGKAGWVGITTPFHFGPP